MGSFRLRREGMRAWAPAALAALVSLLTLEMLRVFVSYLVFVVDQSQRLWIALAVLVVFLFPALVVATRRLLGPARLLRDAVAILVIARLAVQFVEEPHVRVVAGGIAVAAGGWLVIVLLAARRRETAFGIVLGLGLDLGVRTLFGGIDLPWSPDLARHVATLITVGLLILFWYETGLLPEPHEPPLRAAISLIGLGPGLALFHLVSGNPGLAMVKAGLSYPGASAALAIGFVLGVAIATLRLVAGGAMPGSFPVFVRFVTFDILVGSVALWFLWREELAILGVVLSALTTAELLLFALLASPPVTRPGLVATALWVTIGTLLKFVVLFVYYSETGSGPVLALAWVLLSIAAIAGAIRLPAGLGAERIDLRGVVSPAMVVLVLLLLATAVQTALDQTPEGELLAGNELTVMTYNIQQGFSIDNAWDLEATAREIERANPDIVVLQEVSRGWLVMSGNEELDWLSDRLDMPYAWGPSSDDGLWGNAILTRLPIINEVVVPYQATENLKRSALATLLDAGPMGAVAVVGTHLDNPSDAAVVRFEQVGRLVELYDGVTPTILAGDLNAVPDDSAIERIEEAGLIDAAGVLAPDTTTSQDGRRIDYIFVSPEFEILNVAVPDTGASDHKPVIATVRLTLE